MKTVSPLGQGGTSGGFWTRQRGRCGCRSLFHNHPRTSRPLPLPGRGIIFILGGMASRHARLLSFSIVRSTVGETSRFGLHQCPACRDDPHRLDLPQPSHSGHTSISPTEVRHVIVRREPVVTDDPAHNPLQWLHQCAPPNEAMMAEPGQEGKQTREKERVSSTVFAISALGLGCPLSRA